ncbi:hypothetical protein L3X38_016909 [Prunus dulcis]|uniref:Reverse transcriptase zinc-binding domain-containing protein n=1 Tax=Prunus dulcis TaxID=3755 RepID=A0AAD4W688_PRUDU|nr:hypothetical protein L3X38_016909 [Prunus dulcis]
MAISSTLRSLLAQLLHDKYYPGGSFISAGSVRGSSWGWKGILQGRSVLIAGLRWRVGNGDNIRVKEDPWLPVPYTFKIISHHADMPIYVRDSIDLVTKQWRGAEVERLFMEIEAKLINGLAISRWGCPDKLIWHFTKHGGFTTAVDEYLEATVPPKIKSFIWRACLNALVVRQNLKRRHVDLEDVCALCGGEGESQWDRSDFQIWQKPADGWMKFNCDGAWMQAYMRGGAGWVARDSMMVETNCKQLVAMLHVYVKTDTAIAGIILLEYLDYNLINLDYW